MEILINGEVFLITAAIICGLLSLCLFYLSTQTNKDKQFLKYLLISLSAFFVYCFIEGLYLSYIGYDFYTSLK